MSALLHLRAEYRGPRWQVYLFKPLTTSLLVLLALVPPSAQGPRYQAAIGVGLVCSLLGDAFLMLPRDRFVPGLASFLLAHVAYIAAFSAGGPLGAAPVLLLPLVALALPLLWALWPRLGRLRLPVLLYGAVLLVMVWQAWTRRLMLPSLGATLAAIGATLFMLSDSLLAMDRFRGPLRHAHALIMIPYVGAQALLALSVSAG